MHIILCYITLRVPALCTEPGFYRVCYIKTSDSLYRDQFKEVWLHRMWLKNNCLLKLKKKKVLP